MVNTHPLRLFLSLPPSPPLSLRIFLRCATWVLPRTSNKRRRVSRTRLQMARQRKKERQEREQLFNDDEDGEGEEEEGRGSGAGKRSRAGKGGRRGAGSDSEDEDKDAGVWADNEAEAMMGPGDEAKVCAGFSVGFFIFIFVSLPQSRPSSAWRRYGLQHGEEEQEVVAWVLA